jgi:prephenate dehydrogenase
MATAAQFDTLAIIGAGLIGGSIGLAARKRGIARRVVGIGRRQSSLRVARNRGAIDTGTTSVERGVADAELIIVCTPVETIVDLALQAASHCRPGTLITDAGSSKESIVTALDHRLPDTIRYVGSHPMAGSEASGPAHAQEDLLENRMVIVTPTRKSDTEARQQLERFWSALGARVVEMSPTGHDHHVAAVSHVPHLVAAVLAAATSASDLNYVASGWLDTTRVAAGDVELWEQIVRSNRPHVLKSLERFGRLLARLQDAIAKDDDSTLHKVLEEAKRKRDTAMQRQS